jgi:glycosyltransferase involved in cell wall biosynthesis
MRLLISALSCNASLGSEALVGFRYAEALAQHHKVAVLASSPSETPAGATLVPCEAGPCSFNEVGAVSLLRFELRQLRLARRLARGLQDHRTTGPQDYGTAGLHDHKGFDFEVVHRVTPSAIQVPTWAGRLGQPLVLGPLIAADPVGAAFLPFLQRPVSRPDAPRWHPARVAGRLCRMLVAGAARRQSYLQQAKRILVGTRTALRQVPEPWREKCRLVTYSGVEHEVFRPESGEGRKENGEGGAGTTGLRDYGTTDRSLRLLFVGRLVPYKGVELLLRAVAVASKKCALSLDIVGGGDPVYKDYLVRLCSELGILVEEGRTKKEEGAGGLPSPLSLLLSSAARASVRFLPSVARSVLPGLYQQADVFCFPTLCDTYGIALLEAMSCGCAVVVSDVAGAGEIVNGENGLKVPLEAPEQYVSEYAEKLVTLAGDRDLRARLGAGARQHILREHDWGRIGQQVLDVYEELERGVGAQPVLSSV